MTVASAPIDPRADLAVRVLAPLSLAHSFIYAALLATVVAGDRADQLTNPLGWAHGLGWIAMSMLCITAAARRWIPVRTALAVAVLGGIGPFVGTYEFMRLRRDAGARIRSN